MLDENFEEPLRRRRNEAELTAVLRTRLPAAAGRRCHGHRAIREGRSAAPLRRRFPAPDRSGARGAPAPLGAHQPAGNRGTGQGAAAPGQAGWPRGCRVGEPRQDRRLSQPARRTSRARPRVRQGWLAGRDRDDRVRRSLRRAGEGGKGSRKRRPSKPGCGRRRRKRPRSGRDWKRRRPKSAKRRRREREATILAKKKTVQLWLGGCIRVTGAGWFARLEHDHRPAPGSREPARPGERKSQYAQCSWPPPCRRGKDWTWLIRSFSKGIRAFAFPSLMRWNAWTIPGSSANTAMSACLPTRMAVHCCRSTARPAAKACASIRLKPAKRQAAPGCPSPCRTASTRSRFARVGPPIGGKSDDRLVVLVFRDQPVDNYIVEAYRLPDGQGGRVSSPIPPP